MLDFATVVLYIHQGYICSIVGSNWEFAQHKKAMPSVLILAPWILESNAELGQDS